LDEMSAAVDDLAAPATSGETPRRVFRARVARERFDYMARLRDRLGRPPLGLVAGYSVKTNPRAELLRMAYEHGFFAETISEDEVAWARRNGFAPEQIVYNGPEPLRERASDERLELVFADSVEAFERNLRLRTARVFGARLRPSMIASRFGVPVDEDDALAAVLGVAPRDLPFGVSFHARHEDFKGASWSDVADDVLDRAVALERRTGRRVVAFDVGGGWEPAEFDASFQTGVRRLVDRIVASLPYCTRLFFEPGQELCTPVEALLTTVVEVRERRARREVVVDAGFPDWPQMHAHEHGLFAWRGERWQPLGHGPDRLHGRTCLEYDLIEGLRFPDDVAPGDRLLIADTGSYDHAMAFEFARGAEHE
jgi:diaminopimelate decarboxylase